MIESLEARHLLASDFLYDHTASLTGLDATFSYDVNAVRLIDNNTSSVLQSLPVSQFTGVVRILGSNVAGDRVVISPASFVTADFFTSILIDGQNGDDRIEVAADTTVPSANIQLTSETITVAASVDLSTQGISRASGSINFDGINITLSPSSSLRTDSQFGLGSGNINLRASLKPPTASLIAAAISPVLVTDNQVAINLTSAQIVGRDVTISADTATQTRWDDVGEYSDDIAKPLLTALSTGTDIGISLLSPLSGQVKIQKASSNINLASSSISATGAVNVLANASADASFDAVGINARTVPVPFLAVIGYGQTDTKANISVTGNTSIVAARDVNLHTNVESQNNISTRGMGNSRLSGTDEVNFALSIALAFNNFQSTIATGADTLIQSNSGNISVHAEGNNEIEAQADSIIFQDGVAGVAVSLAIDNGTVTSTIDGTLSAASPTGSSALSFNAAQVVNVTEDSITLSGIPASRQLTRGDKLIYSAGPTAIAGLVNGQEYVVADVENVPAGGAFNGTQKIRLASALPLDIGNDAAISGSTQTLAKLAIATIAPISVGASAANNLILNIPSIPSGTLVTYLGPNSKVAEENISATFTRSATGDRVTRTVGVPWSELGLFVGQTIQLTEAAGNSRGYTVAGFSPDGMTMTFVEANVVTNGLFEGFALKSTPEEPTGIGNLKQGTEYETVLVGGRLQLRDPANPANFIKYSSSGTGIQGFRYLVSTKSFAPTTAVNPDRDTITIANHGFQTGDLLEYRTDLTKSSARDIYRFESSNPNAANLLGTTQLPDSPIDGMRNGFYYFVTRVDANTIRLSESPTAAVRAEIVDLSGAPTGTHAFSFPETATGIEVKATLTTTNRTGAGVELSDGKQPWSDVAFNALNQPANFFVGLTNGQELVNSLRKTVQGKQQDKTGGGYENEDDGYQDPGVPLEFAGCVAVNVFNHTVETRIGSTAKLLSGRDLLVTSSIEQLYGSAVSSEATRNGLDGADTSNGGGGGGGGGGFNQPREDVEISIAVSYVDGTNHSITTISDGAQLNARGATSIDSTLDYPSLVDSSDSALNAAETVKEQGLSGLSFLLDGMLGFSSIFNTTVSALAGDPGSNAADKFVLGAAFSLTFMDNQSIASVGAGALINQDPIFSSTTQSVDVAANTHIETIDVSQNAAFNLGLPGLTDAGTSVFKEAQNTNANNTGNNTNPPNKDLQGKQAGAVRGTLQSLVNPFGISGKDAVGPSVIYSKSKNDTIAEVKDGAKINAGLLGTGVSVISTQDVMSVAVAQTGGTASEFGLTASITVDELTSTTRASIGNNAVILAPSLDVQADDVVDRYGIDGSYVFGNKIGLGIAVGLNFQTRTTLAFIGFQSLATDTQLGPATIDIDGEVHVDAHQGGNQFVFGLAGTTLTDSRSQPATEQPNPPPPGNPVAGFTLAVGASVALNEAHNKVLAFIDDPAVTAESLRVTAESDYELRTIVIGGAAGTRQGSTNLGIGGAFGVNNLENTTFAYIADSEITSTGFLNDVATRTGVLVSARDNTSIYADGGGVALLFAKGTQAPNNIALGLGFALNDISTATRVLIDSSTVNSAGGNVRAEAISDASIVGVSIGGAGAISIGGSGNSIGLSGAGAGSKNQIIGVTLAECIDSTIIAGAPLAAVPVNFAVELEAVDLSNIQVDGGAVALGVALFGQGSSYNLSFAVGIGINDLFRQNSARSQNSSITANSLSVLGRSLSIIDCFTLGGALTAAGNSGALSGAGSGNKLNLTTTAIVDRNSALAKTLDLTGDLSIVAEHKPTIIADAGGFAIAIAASTQSNSTTGTLSLGIAAALNEINSTVSAFLVGMTMPHRARDISVTAYASPTIRALTISGAGALAWTNGSAFTLAGAGAGSENTITSTVTAAIDNNATNTLIQGRNLSVVAQDASIIDANAGAIAILIGLAEGKTNISVGIGISLALNTITARTLAELRRGGFETTGNTLINAFSQQSISALTIAGAGAASISGGTGTSITFVGAGTGSGNDIDSSTRANIVPSTTLRSTGGRVDVSATNSSSILAQAYGGAVGLQVGQGGALSIGVAMATNEIVRNVIARIDGAVVTAQTGLSVTSSSTADINARTVGFAISAAGGQGQGVTVAAAGAGAQSTNTITGVLDTAILNGADVTTVAGDILVQTLDTSTIIANAGGGTLAISASTQGIAVAGSISAGLAYNTIDQAVSARIINPNTDVVSGGKLDVIANSQATITTKSVSVAGAIAIANPEQGLGIALVGVGAESRNRISNEILATIKDGARVNTTGTTSIRAIDNAVITAEVPAVSLSFAIGVSVGIGVTLASNDIANLVRAEIVGAIATSTAGSIILVSQAIGTANVTASATSIALGLSASGAGGEAISRIGGSNTAEIGINANVTAASGEVRVSALSTSSVSAEGKAIVVGTISLGAMLVTAEVTQNTLAQIGSNARITAGNLNVVTFGLDANAPTHSTRNAHALVIAAAPGTVGGGGGKATASVPGKVEALINTNAIINVSGAMAVKAVSAASVDADAEGGTIGVVNIAVLLADAKIEGVTRAVLAPSITINAGALDVQAIADKTVDSKLLVVGVSIAGGAGGQASSLDNASTTASIGASPNNNVFSINVSGPLSLISRSSISTTADARGGTGGAINGGGFIANATSTSNTSALILDDAEISAGNVQVLAEADDRQAKATLLTAFVNVVGVTVTKAEANILGDVIARVGSSGRIVTPTSGNVEVLASSGANVQTDAEGGGGSVIAVAAFESKSNLGTSADRAVTSATVGDSYFMQAGTLRIAANSQSINQSRLFTVGIGGVSSGSANADGLTFADTLATTGDNVRITTAGNISLESTSLHAVTSNETAASGGAALAVASAAATSRLDGSTITRFGASNIIQSGGDINVLATINGAGATTNLVAGSGGVISIGSSKAMAINNPVALVELRDNSSLNASGNVRIQAIGRGEVDINGQSSGGGIVQVAVAWGEGRLTPTVDARLSRSSKIVAIGNILVDASLKNDTASGPPSDIIQDRADDADNVAVEVFNDTVDFSFPLSSDEAVVYQAPANATAIGGLTKGYTYNVQVVSPGKTLSFGSTFNASTLNPLRDVITFPTAHNLHPGDAVWLRSGTGLSIIESWQTTLPIGNPLRVDPNAVLYVRGIYSNPAKEETLDPFSIRLARTQTEALAKDPALLKKFNATTVNAATDRLTIAGHGFVENQAVTYRAATAYTFATEMVDVKVVDASYKDKDGKTVKSKDIERRSDRTGLHFNNNNIFILGHGFATGDAVTYRTDGPTIGGLINGETYFVIVLNENEIQLARTYHQAVGLAGDDRGNGDPADDIVPIARTPIQLTPAGSQANTHSLARNIKGLVDGQSYYVRNISGNTFQLSTAIGGSALDIDANDTVEIRQRNGALVQTIRPLTRSGDHSVGNLGIDLKAGSGTQSLIIDLTSQPASNNHVLLGPGGLPLSLVATPSGDGQSSVRASGGSGGVIDVNVPTATLTVTPSVKTQVNSLTSTSGNIEVYANSSFQYTTNASTTSGGVLSVGEAHADTIVTTAPTVVTVTENAVVNAAGDVIISSESRHGVSAIARAAGGGVIAGKVAETAAELRASTQTVFEVYTKVTAGQLLRVLSTVNASGYTLADTYTVAIGGGADSDNTNINDDQGPGVTIVSPADIVINKAVRLVGNEVDIKANIASINATAVAKATAYSPILIGVVSAFANANVDITASSKVLIEGSYSHADILGYRGVDIQALAAVPIDVRFAEALAVALIPPQAAYKTGTTSVTGIVEARDKAHIAVGPRTDSSRLASRASQQQLALLVSSTSGTIWNADVDLFSPIYELIIDSNGNAVRQTGITYRKTGNSIAIDDIINRGPGQILFEGGYAVVGNLGKVVYDLRSSDVNIVTSFGDLFVNDIRPYAPGPLGVEPQITIDARNNGLSFDVEYRFGTGAITITNNETVENDFNIRLQGTIDNPLGTTTINSSRTVASGSFDNRQGVIRTNRLIANVGGSFGLDLVDELDRIPVDIVESEGRPAFISINAGEDIFVGLQGINRDQTLVDFRTMTNEGSRFTAGNNADIMLLGGLDQRASVINTPLGIIVHETFQVLAPFFAPQPTFPPAGPRNTFVTDHFRISSTLPVSAPLAQFGSGGDLIPTTYILGRVTAGRNINIYKADSVTSTVNIRSETNILTQNPGNLDARSNGFVDFREVEGDMRVGRVSSSNDLARLISLTGSVIDVPDDLAIQGDAAEDLIGVRVIVNAPTRFIGSPSNRLEINSSVSATGSVLSYALNDIYLTETIGDMHVDSVFSRAGSVDIVVTAGDLLEFLNDVGPDLIGSTITLSLPLNNGAAKGDIGTIANAIEINSSFAVQGGLVAEAAGNIVLTELENELYIRQINGPGFVGLPTLVLRVREDGSDRNDMILLGTAYVANATLTAGDDFRIDPLGVLSDADSVVINVDPSQGDLDPQGATLEILGLLSSNTVRLNGGDDIDHFEIVPQSGSPAIIQVFGGLPAYPTYPGDTLKVLPQGASSINTITSLVLGEGHVDTVGRSMIDYHSIEVVDIGGVNEPPQNVLPAAQSIDVLSITLSSVNGNQLQVTDPDAGNASNFSVTLSVPTGTLTLLSTTGLTLVGNGTGNLQITGTIADINAALSAGVTFTAPAATTGTIPLTIVSNDAGNTGASGPLTDTDVLNITISDAVNDRPVNHYRTDTSSETRTAILSLANGNALSVTDIDAGAANNFSVTLTLTVGTLELSSTTNITATGDGTSATPLVLTGTLTDINAALANGLTVRVPDDFFGQTFITMVSDDAGNTGPGGPLTDTDVFPVRFIDLNLAPVNSLPPDIVTDQRTIFLSVAGGRLISVSDADAGDANNFSVSLTTTQGSLALLDDVATRFPNVFISGNRTSSLAMVGTLTEINQVLTNQLQLIYPFDFFGDFTVTVVSNDAGNTGVPGPLMDTDVLNVTINPEANDPPVNSLPFPIVTNGNSYVLSAASGNALSVTDIDAGNANNFRVTLVGSVGTLELIDASLVTASGNGTIGSLLVLVGTVANINATLAAGLKVVVPNGFLGVNNVTMLSNDAGNTGLGGPKTDSDVLSITFVNADVNDPPVNHLPPDFRTNEIFTLSAANGNALSVSDPDAGNAANFTVVLTNSVEYLTLTNSAGIQASGRGTLQDPLVLIGTISNINAALAAGITFAHDTLGVFARVHELTMISNDNGNTGSGGPKTDIDTMQIRISGVFAINDPPLNSLPANITTDKRRVELSANMGNQLSVSDPDAGDAENFEVLLSIQNATLSLINPRVNFGIGAGAGSITVLLTGPLNLINQTLANGIVMLADDGFDGPFQLRMLSNDAGNTGSGGPLTDTDFLTISLAPAVNDPPVNHLPPNFGTSLSTLLLSSRTGNAISVTDEDAGDAANFVVQIAPTIGTLSLPAHANITVSGAGTSSSALTLTGQLKYINAALAAGLQVTVPGAFNGINRITVLSNDAGNTGIGGPLTDLDSMEIMVSSDLNDPPANVLPAPVITDTLPIVFSSALGNALSVVDPDAGDATNFTVQLIAANGSLSLSTVQGVTTNGQGTVRSPLFIQGSLAQINAVLASGLQLVLPAGFVGNTSLRIISDDAGNTGLGGPLQDDDTLPITVTAGINDGPTNILPAPIVTDVTTITLSQANGNALSVADIDAGSAPDFQVSLSLPIGSLALSDAAGISASGLGTLASPLVLTGTLANINTALARGLIASLPPAFTGTTSLVVLSNDNGNTGLGGPLTDLDLLPLTVEVDVNDPPVNKLPPSASIAASPYTLSAATGNAIRVTDVDAGQATNFSVRLTLDGAGLELIDINPAGVTVVGDGSLAVPMVLTGSLDNINAALATGLIVTPHIQVFGNLQLEVHSNDAGNTGSGGPKTDTDYLVLNVQKPANEAPYIMSVSVNSGSWATDFRDYVDGDLGDKLATGYRVPYGTAQLISIPWVNVDQIQITFSEDVGKSLSMSDFSLIAAPGFTALAGVATIVPKILNYSYDPNTYTAILQLSGMVPAAVLDLQISSAGVTDSEAVPLDGEWVNGVTVDKSGNSTPGGDFSFRLFFLPGDAIDQSQGNGVRTVNTNDSQIVRDRQNGFVILGVGAIGYDARADLDGSGFINSNDSRFVRDLQNGIIFRQAGANIAQNQVSHFDVNNDRSTTPMDALLVINSINSGSPGLPADSDTLSYLDVSGDGQITPLDALLVINQINSASDGEGEWAPSIPSSSSNATSSTEQSEPSLESTSEDYEAIDQLLGQYDPQAQFEDTVSSGLDELFGVSDELISDIQRIRKQTLRKDMRMPN